MCIGSALIVKVKLTSSEHGEPPYKQWRMDFSHISHEIFECVGINLEFSKEKYTADFRDTWVVRCSNIDVLLEKVYNISGQVSVHDLHFKIGLDYEQISPN